MTTWGTVTLADEPLELILAYCAYHSRLGASEIHLYLDNGTPEDLSLLERFPNVYVTRCTDAFWAEHGGRPHIQTQRQDIIANEAYMDANVEWLAHLDADEFIHTTDPMGQELAACPDRVVGMRMQTRERVWRTGTQPQHIFEGIFRRPIPGPITLDRAVLGRVARYTQRGLAGHAVGKTIARTGRGLTLSVHAPRDFKSHHIMESQTMRTLHFDGLTPLHWTLKRLRYATLPHADNRIDGQHFRWNQVAAIRESETLDDAMGLQRQVTCIDAATETQLRLLHLLEDAPRFDPAQDIAALFPQEKVDLSVAHFNASLLERQAEFVEAMGIS